MGRQKNLRYRTELFIHTLRKNHIKDQKRGQAFFKYIPKPATWANKVPAAIIAHEASHLESLLVLAPAVV
jgi:hypothetical protein